MARVFLDIESRVATGRLLLELFEDKAPKAVGNFQSLCIRRSKGFQGSYFHRIVAPEFLVQGGDILGNGDGLSYNEEAFEDENVGEMKRGMLCMANEGLGTNTNKSQFFIALSDQNIQAPIFGRVVKGFDVLDQLGDVVVDKDDRPVEGEEVFITRCGTLKYRPKSGKVKRPEEERKEQAKPKPDSTSITPTPTRPRAMETTADRPSARARPETQPPPKRTRSKSPEIILKGRGAMKFRERRDEYRR